MMELNWNLIFVIIIIIHAIGHFFPGFVHTFELIKLSFLPSNDSWLLNNQLSMEKSTTKLLSILFLVLSIGFFAIAGLFWMDPQNNLWKFISIPLVLISLFLFIAWWSSFTINIPIGAMIGNIILIYGIITM